MGAISMRFSHWVFPLFFYSLFLFSNANAAGVPSMVGVLKQASSEQQIATGLSVHQQYEYKDEFKRDTPRGTLEGFTQAAYEQDYALAAKYLDLRYLPDGMTKELVAEELHLGIMDIVVNHGSRIIPVAPIAARI